MSLLLSAATAAAPLVGGCGRPAEVEAAPCWNPDVIPGLDLHFDATRLDSSPVDSTDFATMKTGARIVSARGHVWTHTGNIGRETSAMVDAAPLSQAKIRATFDAGKSKASVCILLEDNDFRNWEITVRKWGEIDSVELRGFRWGVAGLYRSPSRLVLGGANVIEVRITPRRLEVWVNHIQVAATDLNDGWSVKRYGVGLRDGDAETVIRGFVISDTEPRRLRDGEPVERVPQLAQPNNCLTAHQQGDAKAPVLKLNSIGSRQSLLFDGADTLFTGAPLDGTSMTIVAVIQGRGTIIGPDESTGGLQLRIDDDGSLAALNAGRAGIAQTQPGAVGESATIAAFSLDSVGNSALYVDGRPAAGALSPVKFPPGVTMTIGSAYNAEFFSGTIGEILRWNRPLGGAELRTVFDALAAKWSIPVARPVNGPTTAPLRATALKGSNIIPPLVDLANDDPAASAWLNLWSRWDWRWIELSVRRAVEQGANTIRLIGDVNAVHSGLITEATYHARLQQVISLCQSLGCRFYYCAIDLRHKRDADSVFIAHFLSGVAAVLARHSNVVAIELCNEVASAYDIYPEQEVLAWIGAWAAAIRAAAPAIPLSISDVSPGTLHDKIGQIDQYAKYAYLVDFFDLHVYDGLEIASDSAILAPYELGVDRPMLIGEFGIDRTAAGADPGAFYSRVKTLRDSSRLVVGALQWGAINDQWGLYSESDDRLEVDIADEWARF
ncbi:cellulase family glycosylhydrolase [Mycobacterium sp. OAE908]|uniref:cellulase family glycosylhydrolase n=1 Tax=Mycobacterium sp. OAE908 TaxID=2817899 RepID=UPI001AE60D6D